MRLEPKIYILQKVNDPFTFGTVGWTNILMPTPSPADLDADATLDEEEKTGILDTTETVQIDKIYALIPDVYPQFQVDRKLILRGMARMVIKLGVAGDGTYATTLSKVSVDIGLVNKAGTFSSKAAEDSTPNQSQTSTTYKTFSAQALFCDIADFGVSRDQLIAVRLRVYAYVASGSTGGKVKIICTRNEADSYLEACIGLKEYQP